MPTNFRVFAWRVMACHVVSYFIAGLLAYKLMDYRGLFQTPGLAQLMRPMTSPWIAAGPTLQVFRGLLIAAVLFPFRQAFLESVKGRVSRAAQTGEEPLKRGGAGRPVLRGSLEGRSGALKLFALTAGLSALSASGAAPGSFEGIIYTQLTLTQHLQGLPELLLQNATFAWAVVTWHKRPGKAWNIIMAVCVTLVALMSLAGVLAAGAGVAR